MYVKLPNGTYGRFSSVIDDFSHINLTREELKAQYMKSQEEEFERVLKRVDSRPPESNKELFEEAVETIELMHGEKTRKKLEKDLENKNVKERDQ